MKSFIALLIATFLPFLSATAQTQELKEGITQEQIDNLKKQVEVLEKELDGRLAQRNANAGDIFLQASTDPKAALALWEKSTKLIEFDREELRESDFRDWQDRNSDKARDDRFIESLMIQLKYVGLSCQAAEAEKPEDVSPSLLAYVDGLSRMEEPPTNEVLRSVADSNFAKAYNLQSLLGQNENWESVPYSISAICEKTILPHLRKNNTGGLINAWDKRIEQQTRLAQSLNEMTDKAESEARKNGENGENGRRVLKDLTGGDRSEMIQSHDKDDFVREVLPRLKWARLKDQFIYVSLATGAGSMLQFVKAHLTHELGEEFLNDFKFVIADMAPSRGLSN